MKHSRILMLFVAALLAAAARPAIADTLTQDGSASEIVVRGTVIGPDSARLAGQTVVLHRVLDGAGATIAEAMTDAGGEFVLRAPDAADPKAIYFVAARFGGELYIAAPFRATENPAPQILLVGIPGTSATALVTPAPVPTGRALTNRNWLLLALPLIAVIAVAVYTFVPRARMPQRRTLLIRAAELDERMASVGRSDDRLRDERARLAALLQNRGA